MNRILCVNSIAMSTSKAEKEKLQLIQEKSQQILSELLKDEDNKYCVDCDAKGELSGRC